MNMHQQAQQMGLYRSNPSTPYGELTDAQMQTAKANYRRMQSVINSAKASAEPLLFELDEFLNPRSEYWTNVNEIAQQTANLYGAYPNLFPGGIVFFLFGNDFVHVPMSEQQNFDFFLTEFEKLNNLSWQFKKAFDASLEAYLKALLAKGGYDSSDKTVGWVRRTLQKTTGWTQKRSQALGARAPKISAPYETSLGTSIKPAWVTPNGQDWADIANVITKDEEGERSYQAKQISAILPFLVWAAPLLKGANGEPAQIEGSAAEDYVANTVSKKGWLYQNMNAKLPLYSGPSGSMAAGQAASGGVVAQPASGLSTGAKVAIGVLGVSLIGGVAYMVMNK